MDNLKQEKIDEKTLERSNIYSLLAQVYSKEPCQEFLKYLINKDVLEILNELGLEISEYLNKKSLKIIEEELAVEYCRLFVGPGKHIYPYESAYRDQNVGLSSETARNIKNFIGSYGFEFDNKFVGFYDHISVELEFMSKLIYNEKEAWRNQDLNQAARILELEEQFIEEHLVKWVSEFSDRVIEEAELSFYKEYAKLTKEFILFENSEIKNLLEQVKS